MAKAKEVKENQEERIELKKKDKLIIMGFAPDSRNEAPLNDENFDVWSINELYLEMPILAKRSTCWFQLHGTEPPTGRDPQHKEMLASLQMPVFMWRKHPEIPNSIIYPREQILKEFDIYGQDIAPDILSEYDRQYFTNTISWLIALGVAFEYKEIHIFGVNMAQEQEYASQRPSCEFFLGWARGRGIKIFLPKQSDLLMSGYQYGFDECTRGFTKQLTREKELSERLEHARNERIQLNNQAQNALSAEQQLAGALENTRYAINLGPRGYASVRGPEKEPEPKPKEKK